MKFYLFVAFGACVSVGTQRMLAEAYIPSSSASTSRTERTFLPAASVELKASDVETSQSDRTSDDDEDLVTFPPPLSQLDRLKRAAVFWSKAVPIVANYYGLIGNLKLKEILGESLDDKTIEVCKIRSAPFQN